MERNERGAFAGVPSDEPGRGSEPGDLAELGWTRTAVDRIFQKLPVLQLDGVRKPMIRVGDYLALLEESTYRGDRVRPC